METKIPIETGVGKETEEVQIKIFYLDNLLTAIIDYSDSPMNTPEEVKSDDYEQITYVAKGQLFVIINEKKRHLKKGDVYYIASKVPYSIQTLSKNVRLVKSFSPVPKEFLYK